MSKPKRKREVAALYEQISRSAEADKSVLPGNPSNHDSAPIADEILALSKELAGLLPASPPIKRELPKMKKFRFQLLHAWMAEHVAPCRVADVGGGKGLLTYLLQQSGWSGTVIDPIPQDLPAKYKDLNTGRQMRISPTEVVPRIDRAFEATMARDFDLLVAMHAHGCNIQLIDAAAAYDRRLILLPCCVIQEPFLPPPGIHWIQWLVNYATTKGFTVAPFRLNFSGQNIGLYAIRSDHDGPSI